MHPFELLLVIMKDVAMLYGNPNEFEFKVTYRPQRMPGRPPGPPIFTITVRETADDHEIAHGLGSSLEEAAKAILGSLEEDLTYWQYTVDESIRKQLDIYQQKG